MLPAYRRIHLRLMAEAPPENSGAIAAELVRVLGEYGEVTVTEDGPYWKIPEHLEFNAELIPRGGTAECFDDLSKGSGWTGTGDDGRVWNRAEEDFLHPALRWASLDALEAPFPPRFNADDLVIIRDCQTARDGKLVGVEATVVGFSPPSPDVWEYLVLPVGRELVEDFAEHELAPTGRRTEAAGEPMRISVGRDGEITGVSQPPTR
ncbi:hypothetical protein [Rhizohabitans arisaemae]|uniref:hypothetical protein n=1 Tax=Rhizohabitans arisaemae TaxID=2720610 RepID=UPI0024B0B9E5|nr:hypothetical protein [Rhizohabitans arisaemae]